ncbi:MAG TPA: SRPBCC family protein [Minicystis sp.]|nr:SRPBCC family protein [Minicystis sp.]
MASDTDRIEKKILLKASRARVFRALTDAEEFGSWFGVKLDGPFVAGARVRGVIEPTRVDAAVARAQEPFRGLPVELAVERIEPERLFSFRWHPHAIEPGVDYAAEPMTLVEFRLDDAERGVLLTVIESGFDAIPVARRAKAFGANAGGWALVVELVGKHVAGSA